MMYGTGAVERKNFNCMLSMRKPLTGCSRARRKRRKQMIVALIHWRIKPDDTRKNAFLKHWKTKNPITDRTGLIAEFLSDSLKIAEFPYITWHLDPESFGNFRSYVTVGLWQDSDAFKEQVAAYFNDDKPLLPFDN